MEHKTYWPKDTEFCDPAWNFTNLPPNCTKFVLKKKKKMVMENQKMVMEKSWKSHGTIFFKSVGT